MIDRRKPNLLNMAWQIVSLLVIMSGVIISYATTAERVREHEITLTEIKSRQDISERYNSDEHKQMLQALARIEGAVKARGQR